MQKVHSQNGIELEKVNESIEQSLLKPSAVGLVKEMQYYWLTFIMTCIVLCDRLSRIKGWAIWAAAQSTDPHAALKHQGDEWETWCQLLENFTQESFGVVTLVNGPTPTDIGCVGWGWWGFRSSWGGDFQARTAWRWRSSLQERSVSGRGTVSASTLSQGFRNKKGAQRSLEGGVNGVGR